MKCLAPAFADRQDRQLELSKTNAPAPLAPPPERQVQTHPAPAFKIGGAERNGRACWKPPLKLAASRELRPAPVLTGPLKPSGGSRSSQPASGGKRWRYPSGGLSAARRPPAVSSGLKSCPEKLPVPSSHHVHLSPTRPSELSGCLYGHGALLHQLTDGVPRAPASRRNGRRKEEGVSSRVPGSQTPSPGHLSSLRSKTKPQNPAGLWQKYILGAKDRPPKGRCVLPTACRGQARLRPGLRAEPPAL